MVYLTFIKQKELCCENCFLPQNVQQLYSLAHFLEKSYGKPTVLITASDVACVVDSKLVNLVFGVHGIRATKALSRTSSSMQSELFIRDVLSDAEVKNPQHIVMILPDKQIARFLGGNVPSSVACLNSAESWHSMYFSAERHPIFSGAFPLQEISKDTLRYFIGTLESLLLI